MNMFIIKGGKSVISLALAIYTFFTVFTPSASALTEKTATAYRSEYIEYGDSVACGAKDIKVGSRIWELLFGGDSGGEHGESISLIPGGEVFGMKIKQDHVSVVDSKGIPALSAGDVILSINGKSVDSAEDVRSAVAASRGESVTVRARHKGNEIAIEVRPTLEDGEYRLGITLRDGAMGIGTVTFTDPKTGVFGGLGHGIVDGDSGETVSMESGNAVSVVLSGIHKGERGKPGELCGILTEQVVGTLTKNCECGVFGICSLPCSATAEAVKIATRDEVHDGEAKIISTLRGGKKQEYTVEISDVNVASSGSKSFRIKVTDPTLIALCGGIVRGMSGSPIIQNGKLVGAVTHVMVANPTEGYGIFIENMLNAAQNQVIPKAA